MKKNIFFLFLKLRKSPIKAVLFIFLSILFNCTDEKILIDKALEKEKSGKKTEALYDYSVILRKNPSSPMANKRSGFLLAGSQSSFGVAIFHLEKAKNFLREDKELQVKLLDLYLIVDELKSAEEMLEELRDGSDRETLEFMENLISCHKGNLKSKDFSAKLKIPSSEEFIWEEMNSFISCKQKIGIKPEVAK